MKGTANQQGSGTQTRTGKGFGEGFKDSNGDGASERQQNRYQKNRK